MPQSCRSVQASQSFDSQSRPKECHIAKTLARFATDSTITGKYHIDRGGDLLRRSQLTDHIGWTTCLLARARRTRLELSTAGSERAAQDYDQAACNEVHVAITQATEMSTAQTVHKNLSFRFSRAVGSASDTSNDKVLYQPVYSIARQSVFRKNVKKLRPTLPNSCTFPFASIFLAHVNVLQKWCSQQPFSDTGFCAPSQQRRKNSHHN